MPQLNLTREDERLLHFFGVSVEPVMMAPSELKQDYCRLLKAYEKLEDETRPVMWIIRLLRRITSPFGCGWCQ
jgi:hypothetical protein